MMPWCHGWGCRPPLIASHIHIDIGFIESVWEISYAVDGHMGAPLHCYTCAGDGQIFGNWGKVNPIWNCGDMVEAVSHHWLHPTSMSYIYKVFEHLKQLWMGIWQHTHTVATTEVSPVLGELAEIIDNVSVGMIPLRYRWGCRTFQTASHIHVIHI